jgi:tripartite-type tricarboxylate transporter receptor subunit TctC
MLRMTRRSWMLAAGVLACTSTGVVQAQAQRYPTKPVRLVNPFAPGGPVDIVGRAIAQELNKTWGQSVIVDNRPGAGTTIGAGLVARATPDGYTLLVTSVSTAVSVSLYRNLPFDLSRDLVPVTILAQTPLVLAVNPSLPVNSVQELVALARAKSGQVRYASSGAGTISHLAMELFRSQAKIDALTHVPYKGGAPAVAAVTGGEAQALFDQSIAIMPSARAGRLRALAVSSPKRFDAAPELPTFAESGLPAFEVIVWTAIFAPTGTPPAVIATINGDINRLLQTQEVRERLGSLGMTPAGGTPTEVSAFVKREIARWAKVSNEAGVKLE